MNTSRAVVFQTQKFSFSICPQCGARKITAYGECNICGAEAFKDQLPREKPAPETEASSNESKSFAA